MKLNMIRCDRCEKIFEEKNADEYNRIGLTKNIDIALVANCDVKIMDLCPSCMEQLLRFLKGERSDAEKISTDSISGNYHLQCEPDKSNNGIPVNWQTGSNIRTNGELWKSSVFNASYFGGTDASKGDQTDGDGVGIGNGA